MPHFILKYLLRFALFATSRHRLLGLRDWLASIIFVTVNSIVACIFVSLWVLGNSQSVGENNFESYILIGILALVLLTIASAPIAFILKIRRNGITDADYSIASGIDYKSALQSAHAGFDFMGIGAAKLKAQEQELRDAVRAADRQGKQIRMLLVDPEARQLFERLERMDGTTGYSATVQGSMLFLQDLEKNNEGCFEIRLYKPNTIDEVKPLRLFFSGQDCLVSPFSPSTGEKDQGRGLPQLRVTENGFPKKGDATLYRALKRYFESNWTEKNGNNDYTK